MKPYEKSTTDQDELTSIIYSLEKLEINYRITTTKINENGEWVRGWNIDQLVD